MADKRPNPGSDKYGHAQTIKDDCESTSSSNNEQDCCRPNQDSFAGSSSSSKTAVAVPDRPVVSSMAAQGFFGI